MATLTSRSEPQALSNQVATLLSAYEDFRLNSDVPGLMGYSMELLTTIYVHRKHTKRDLFKPQSFYVGSSTTALPSMGFIQEWLKHARQSTLERINKGEYDEYQEDGSYLKRHYNKWIYYDRRNNKLIGKVRLTT